MQTAPQPEADASAPSAAIKPEAAPSAPPTSRETGLTARELGLLELRRLLTAWHRYEPGARAGNEPEDLHQLRVTVRRIDATLSLLKHQLPEPLGRARKTAKVVLRALGAARDGDVHLAQLADYCADLPDEEAAAAAPLRQRLETEGAHARIRMTRVLDSAPTRRWLEALTLASAQGAEAVSRECASAFAVMPERVRRRFRKLRKTVRKLPAKASMDEYHDVRRRAKRLRYAIESGAGMFGKPADDLLKALRRLQDQLGAHQDAYIAKGRLAGFALDPVNGLPPATLFLMGRLAERHSAVISQTSKTLGRLWRRVRGKRWKALNGRLDEVQERAASPRSVLPEIARGQLADAGADLETGVAGDRDISTAPERAAAPQARSLKH